MPWRIGLSLCLAQLLVSCSSPPAPEIPSRVSVGPPQEASATCNPPYKQQFGQKWVWVADQDTGRLCLSYLEQDECVLGMYRDCSSNPDDLREWQGRITEDKLQLIAFYPFDGSQPRKPQCCGGTLHDDWVALDCPGTGICLAGRQLEDHTGFYFETYREEGDRLPIFAQQNSWLALPATAQAQNAVIGPATDTLWVAGLGGLYGIKLTDSSNPEIRHVQIDGAQHLELSPDEQSIYVATSSTVHKVRAQDLQITHSESFTKVLDITSAYSEIWVLDDASIVRLNRNDLSRLGSETAALGTSEIVGSLDNSTAVAVARNPNKILRLDSSAKEERSWELSNKMPWAARNAIFLQDNKLAFVANCHGQSEITCYFELEVVTERRSVPRRLGLVEVSQLSQPAPLDNQRVLLGDSSGLITLIHRDEWRTPIYRRSQVSASADWVAVHPINQRIYILDRAQGRMWAVEAVEPQP